MHLVQRLLSDEFVTNNFRTKTHGSNVMKILHPADGLVSLYLVQNNKLIGRTIKFGLPVDIGLPGDVGICNLGVCHCSSKVKP